MRFRPVLIAALLLAVVMAAPAAAEAKFFKEWGLTAFGNQSSDVDTGDLYEAGIIGHVAAPLVEDQIRIDLRLEGLVGSFWDYGNGIEVGIIPALRLYVGKSFQPYIEGGIGPTYNGLDIQELGTGFNFLSFGGAGLRYHLGSGMSVELGYRLRHISNAGLDDRNSGVTSNQVQFGLAWGF